MCISRYLKELVWAVDIVCIGTYVVYSNHVICNCGFLFSTELWYPAVSVKVVFSSVDFITVSLHYYFTINYDITFAACDFRY